MVRSFLIRGMLVGLVTGVLVFGFSKVFGEPQVDQAIAFESAMEAAKAHTHSAPGAPAAEPEPELVSRGVQAGIGLLTGTVVYCASFGGLFGLVFAFAHGRVGRLEPRAGALVLAAGGFIAVYVVPSLKYPANPPSVGEAETIAFRTALFFGIMLISIVAMVGAAILRQRLAPRQGAWTAALSAAAAYIVVIAVAEVLLPDINEVPDGFPAVVLWRFRIASLGMQFVMWSAIGLLVRLADRTGPLARIWLPPGRTFSARRAIATLASRSILSPDRARPSPLRASRGPGTMAEISDEAGGTPLVRRDAATLARRRS